ncbi:MAG: siderophore-interacting protein [Acidimicrobiales bacterium]
MVSYGTVAETAWLSPSMVRIVFDGEGLAGFEPLPFTDQYVNACFLPEGAPYTVPFDLDRARALDGPRRPRQRRYTVRAWDAERRRLTVDFVAHGDAGFAGRWAQRASRGDRLQFLGPGGSYRPDPEAAWYLFAGDEAALPAIAASMEAVPAGRRCVVRAVVDSADHEIELPAAGGFDVAWLYRAAVAEPADLLLDAVAGLDWWPGPVDVFVHGEAAEVRALRRHLISVRGVDRDAASISPYWRRGQNDEAWRAVKREWLAAQDADA